MWDARHILKSTCAEWGVGLERRDGDVCAKTTRGKLGWHQRGSGNDVRAQRTPAVEDDLMGGVGKESRPRRHLDESICTMIYIGKERVG